MTAIVGMNNMTYNLNLIAQWFLDTGIIQASTIDKQFIKFVEEDGEVAEELIKPIIDKFSEVNQIYPRVMIKIGPIAPVGIFTVVIGPSGKNRV